ncbi:hypothetical protein Hdeb2414_s0011g00369421 [Helianthus debilis subsp. tardiflorus]
MPKVTHLLPTVDLLPTPPPTAVNPSTTTAGNSLPSTPPPTADTPLLLTFTAGHPLSPHHLLTRHHHLSPYQPPSTTDNPYPSS